jgi:hypothetical protein
MPTSARAHRLPGPELHIRAEFRAPLPFVYAWCTDFDAGDAEREKEHYTRRVLERTPRRVVFEDLADGDEGWVWSRHVVTLRPPNAWHSESFGSHREASLDYVLTPLSPGRTRLDLRWRRRPTTRTRTRRSKSAIERESTAGWRHFARALERDYQRSRSGASR